MELTIRQGYLAMFFLLDQFFEKKPTDGLGILLGILNPYLFEDRMPASMGAWEYWQNAAKLVTANKLLTIDEAFIAMWIFLQLYWKKFGFEIEEILQEINKESNKPLWQDSVQKSISAE